MVKIIELEEAAKRIRELFEEVSKGVNQYIVNSNGQALAVLLSFNDFQRFTESKEQAKKRFFEMVDELREYNKDVPYEQIEKDVAQAVAEVRQMEFEKLKNS